MYGWSCATSGIAAPPQDRRSGASAALTTPWGLLGLVPLLLLVRPCRAVLAGAVGRDLIAVLKATGSAELVAALVSAVALVLA